MTLKAFIGPAGVGKTFQLMRAQGDTLMQSPLADGARVLALTFMHGSRRRLDDKLRLVNGLRGRYSCMTIDRFAWELCVRWRSLRRARGLPELSEDQYEDTCDAAGALLEIDDVRRWVSHAFPHVVVDEAQDLTPQRLRILRALEPMVDMLVAADEFQCLSPQLRPNPAMQWLEAGLPANAFASRASHGSGRADGRRQCCAKWGNPRRWAKYGHACRSGAGSI